MATSIATTPAHFPAIGAGRRTTGFVKEREGGEVM
jgi:hypothetical protein